MLEPIALGQGRTFCPGLATDERGVVMGRLVALFFPDLARLVGFLRSYSREISLDDLIDSLDIRETVSVRGGRELMVRFEAAGSHAADRAAQATRMHNGRVFTGSERHFIAYRDRSAPLGYDLASSEDISTEPADILLYAQAGVDARSFGRSLSLRDLVLTLSIRPLTEAERLQEQHPTLAIRCEPGLASSLHRFLWERRIQSRVRTCATQSESHFSSRQRQESTVELVSCTNLPHASAQLLHATPGMTVFVPVQPNILVEWGFRHPVALESCTRLFSEDETALFHSGTRPVEILAHDNDEVDIRDLIDVTIKSSHGDLEAPKAKATMSIENVGVELRLARLPSAKAATHALLISLDRLPWLIRLIYMLPAAVLRSYEAVIADPYLIIVNRRGVDTIPFGEPLTELYPQVFAPVGMRLLPRVDYSLLKEHLGIQSEDRLYFFVEETPFSIERSALQPLSRAVVAEEVAKQNLLDLKARTVVDELSTPTVVHERQSFFSLWRGVKTEPRNKRPTLGPPVRPKAALPPPTTTKPTQSTAPAPVEILDDDPPALPDGAVNDDDGTNPAIDKDG